MIDWTSSGLIVDEVPADNPYGFIYRIVYTDGTYYYGKKAMYTIITLPQLKSGEKRIGHIEFKGRNKNGKRIYVEKVQKESGWKTYIGSSDKTEDLVIETREILAFARTKRELTYLEEKCLMQMEALEDPLCLNANIGNRYFRDNLI